MFYLTYIRRFIHIFGGIFRDFLYSVNNEPTKPALDLRLAIPNYSETRCACLPNRIPHIIHQTHETSLLPWNVYAYTVQLINMNRDYVYIFYDAKEREKFIAEHYGEDSDEMRAYRCLLPGTWKADLFRLCVLYAVGGVYIDCKGTTIKPLRKLISQSSSFVSVIDIIPYRLASGALLACSANHPIMGAIKDECVCRILTGDYGINQLDCGGPETCGRVLQSMLDVHPSTPFKVGRHEWKGVDDNSFFVDLVGTRYLFGEYIVDNAGLPIMIREPSNYLFSKKVLTNRYEIAWVLRRCFVPSYSPT